MIVGNNGSDSYIMRDEYILIEANGILHQFDISLLLAIYENCYDDFKEIFNFDKISLMTKDRQFIECMSRETPDIYEWLSDGKTNRIEVLDWIDTMKTISNIKYDDIKTTRLLEGIYIISQSKFTKNIDILVRSKTEESYVLYLMDRCSIKNFKIVNAEDKLKYEDYTNIFIGDISFLNRILDNHEDKLEGKELIISDIRSNLTMEYGMIYPNIKIDPEKIIYKNYNVTCVSVMDNTPDIAYG